MPQDDMLFDLTPKGDNKVQVALEKLSDLLGKIAEKGKATSGAIAKIFDVSTGAYTKSLNVVASLWDSILGKIAKVFALQAQLSNTHGPVEGVAQPIGGTGKSQFGEAFASSRTGKTTGAVGGAIGGGANILLSAGAAVDALTSKIGKFVEAANPAAAMRLDYAFQDMYATIGEKLVPIMNIASGMVERFGDFLSTLNIDKFIDAFGEVFSALGDVFFSVLEALSPLVELLQNIVVPVFQFFASILKTIADFIKSITSWFWGKGPAKGNRTTAASSVSILGIDQISNRALQAAGRVSQTNYLRQIADNTGRTANRSDAASVTERQDANNIQMQNDASEQERNIRNGGNRPPVTAGSSSRGGGMGPIGG